MKTTLKVRKIQQENQTSLFESHFFAPNPERTLEWLGGVNHDNLSKTLEGIKYMLSENPHEEIQMLVNSFGGTTGIGMTFYDTIRSVWKLRLTTIGSGDVDSSGIIIFLSGERRYITKNTTLLFHLAGRTFGTEKRFSTLDLENILKEDKVKDYQYACVVSDATDGRYSPERVLEMMTSNTVLTAEEAVNMGLAHKVLD